MRTHPRLASLIVALLLVLPASARSADHESKPLAERLGAESRSEADRARDAGRKPAEVIGFLGIAPGMTVVDLIAASGYYTEVLSLAVGPKGKVYAQNPDVVLKMRDGANDKALSARLEGNRLPNVERLDRDTSALALPPESIDAAVTALNFHDVYNARGPEAAAAFLGTVRAFLKPGGVLGVIDHAGGVEGADDEKLHRIDEKLAVEAAKAAGFEVETSDVLRNPEDDRTTNVFDPSVRGQTDRFLLKLRKPE